MFQKQAFWLAFFVCKPYDLLMGQIAAVLTGDLVASTEAGPAATDRAMDALCLAARRLSDWAGADTRFTRHRGDGWQICIGVPGLVLRGTIMLTATLRASGTGLGTRISAAIGEVDRLGEGDLSAASGAAFTIAGQNLDAMSRGARLCFGGPQPIGLWPEAIFDLIDWQSRRWSAEQAEAVALALDPAEPTQADLAARLGITRQALQARLQTAGFASLQTPLRAFEAQDWGVKWP